jgi:hypothetical protein
LEAPAVDDVDELALDEAALGRASGASSTGPARSSALLRDVVVGHTVLITNNSSILQQLLYGRYPQFVHVGSIRSPWNKERISVITQGNKGVFEVLSIGGGIDFGRYGWDTQSELSVSLALVLGGGK